MPLELFRAAAEAREDAATAIDNAAAKARSRYMTTMRAKKDAYDAKYEVAQSVLSPVLAVLTSNPMLAAIDAEAEALGISRQENCRRIKSRRDACVAGVAAIEKITAPAKARLRTATPAEAAAIAARAINQLDRT